MQDREHGPAPLDEVPLDEAPLDEAPLDEAPLASAGLLDPAAPDAATRRALLAYLVEQGCSVEEMQAADARGRLFALAGDRQVRPLTGLLTLSEAATRLRADEAVLLRAWSAFGLPTVGPGTPVLSGPDVTALGTWLAVRDALGEEAASGLARVVGSALARVSEAESAAMRTGLSTTDLGVSGDELVTARAYADVAALVPRIGQLLDALHRQHLEATRVHFEQVDRELVGRAAFRCGVGFADLSGFTRLSQRLSLAELGALLSTFEDVAGSMVHEHGGRTVKFLGDAVMWVCADPTALVATACALVGHVAAQQSGIGGAGGVAHGQVLAQEGDYFGPPVNLAARLVAVATPGQVLVDTACAGLLGPPWRVSPAGPYDLRGFDQPVAAWSVDAGP